MRVTESMITRNLIKSLNTSRNTMNGHQTDIATGKQFQRASDDPVAFTRATRFRNEIVINEQYLANVADAQGWVDDTISILDRINTDLIKAKDLTIQGAGNSADQSVKNTISDQIEDILEEVITLANSSFSGKYLFGGNKIKGDKPFEFDGTSITYNGNSKKINRRIAENYNVEINLDGTQLIDKELFSSLTELRDNLRAGDETAIDNSLSKLDEVSDNVLALSAGMGSLSIQIEMTGKRLENSNLNLKSYLSKTEDTDFVDAITQYNAEEMAYKAALQTTSDAIHLNILNFLR